MAHGSRTLPPLDAIGAALAAREHGSFTAAATALNVTHAAVSRRVAVAERWAGRRLFERHGRGVRTTLEGERLLARLDAVLEEIGSLAEPERSPDRRRPVRIATTPSFARYRLLPALKRVEADDLRVEIVADPRPENLSAAGIDLAFRYGRGGWRAGEETALERTSLVPVMHRSLVDSASIATPDGPDVVATLPLIHNADTTLWRAWLASHGIARRSKGTDRTMFDYASTIAAAETGLGLALFDTSLHALNELPPAMVAFTDAALADPPLGYWMIAPLGAEEIVAIVRERM